VVEARASAVRVVGHPAGLHALLDLPPGTEADVVDRARRHGIAVEGLARFRHPDAVARRDGLVVGFATPSASAWSGALSALGDLLAEVG